MRRLILCFSVLLVSLSVKAQLNNDSIKNGLSLQVYSDGTLGSIRELSSNLKIGFTGALWVRADDNSFNPLHAFSFFNGIGTMFHDTIGDLHPGPITNDVNALSNYNKVWKITRSVVDSFLAGQYGGNIPPEILNWPAHGRVNYGESYYLAPFIDFNQDSQYNPFDGDYPCFPGDEALFFVSNDSTTSNNQRPALNIEILGMAYCYKQGNFLDSTLFVNFSLRNKGDDLWNFEVGVFEDFDVGNPIDDLTATFIDQNTVITYNSDSIDEGAIGFGYNPPAVGLTVRTGIRAKAYDGIDNDKDGCVDGIRDAQGNCIPENYGMNNIEYWKLSASHYFNNNTSSINGNPSDAKDFNAYMSSKWLDGNNLVIDSPSGFLNTNNGDGHRTDTLGIPTRFCFAGTSYDTSGAFLPNQPSNWFENPLDNNDKRIYAGLGKKNVFVSEDILQISLAYFYARDTNSLNSFDAAYAMAQKINAFKDSAVSCAGSRLIAVAQNQTDTPLELYPNPANQLLRISAPHYAQQEALIYNTNSQLVSKTVLNAAGEQIVDVVDLPVGLYIIKIGSQTQRFMISR